MKKESGAVSRSGNSGDCDWKAYIYVGGCLYFVWVLLIKLYLYCSNILVECPGS